MRFLMSDDAKKPLLHSGDTHSSPYPTSRLAPAFAATEIGEEMERAKSMLDARTSAKLHVIADQIKFLQEQARKVLNEARQEQALTRARCAFKRIPGKLYHLYTKPDGSAYFSMLSPQDWDGQPPDPHAGSFRLESDFSWTPVEKLAQPDDTRRSVQELLRIGGLTADSDER